MLLYRGELTNVLFLCLVGTATNALNGAIPMYTFLTDGGSGQWFTT